jgi:hypothetical protein
MTAAARPDLVRQTRRSAEERFGRLEQQPGDESEDHEEEQQRHGGRTLHRPEIGGDGDGRPTKEGVRIGDQRGDRQHSAGQDDRDGAGRALHPERMQQQIIGDKSGRARDGDARTTKKRERGAERGERAQQATRTRIGHRADALLE